MRKPFSFLSNIALRNAFTKLEMLNNVKTSQQSIFINNFGDLRLSSTDRKDNEIEVNFSNSIYQFQELFNNGFFSKLCEPRTS